MPSGTLKDIPRIQHKPEQWSAEVRERNNARRELVKGNFTHAWSGYKYHAWMSDEVAPLTGSAYNHFGGWAASLVDALGKAFATMFLHVFILRERRHALDHGAV